MKDSFLLSLLLLLPRPPPQHPLYLAGFFPSPPVPTVPSHLTEMMNIKLENGWQIRYRGKDNWGHFYLKNKNNNNNNNNNI
jgi:hypothetical protein